jgi:GST-like protein
LAGSGTLAGVAWRTGRRRPQHQSASVKTMIDLYGLTSPNVQKIFIMLEETGLPYNFKPVDVWASAQYATEFGKLNPNRKIPVIVDRDGPGGRPCTVFESGAILMYLAEKSGRFLPKDTAKKYDAIQWLMIQVTGVGPAFGNFTHFNLFAPKPGNEYAFTRFKTEMLRLYEVIDQRLGETRYLGGDEYSIADIATYPWTRQHQAQGAKIDQLPNFKRWFEDISARPAVKKASEFVATIKSNRESATDDQKDRFFNRGKYARA